MRSGALQVDRWNPSCLVYRKGFTTAKLEYGCTDMLLPCRDLLRSAVTVLHNSYRATLLLSVISSGRG